MYTWTVSRGIVLSGAGTNQISVRWNAPGIDTVQVSVRSAAGCINDSILPVSVNTTLQPVITSNKPPDFVQATASHWMQARGMLRTNGRRALHRGSFQ